MSDSEHTLKYDTPIMSYLNLWLLLFSVWFKVTVPTSIINTFETPRCSKTKQTNKKRTANIARESNQNRNRGIEDT